MTRDVRREGFPAVTVVVPTHSRPVEMTAAVQSALDQDYPGHVTVLIVFDGAEPFEPQLQIPENRDVRIQRNDHIRGLAGARNSGIDATTTGLIAFLDDDDLWLPKKLSLQVALLEQHPEVVLVSSGITMVTPEGDVDRPLTAPVTFRQLLRDRVPELHSSSFLLRTEVLQGDFGGIDEALPGSYAEDYDLVLRAAQIAPVPGVPEPLVRITFAGGSLFGAKWQMISDALQHLLDKYPEFQDEPKGYARIGGQIAFANAALGHRREAFRWIGSTLRHNPVEPRAALAAAVATRAVSADRVMQELQDRGRGL